MAKKAFTLIELLVVISIFGLLIVSAFFSFGKSVQQVRLQMSVEQVASNLRFDQNQVKSGQVATATGNLYCRGYKLMVGDQYYPVQSEYENGSCGDLAEFAGLPHAVGVEVTEITPNADGVIVYFEPPNGAMKFKSLEGTELSSSDVELTFEYVSGNYPVDRKLNLNRAGQINY